MHVCGPIRICGMCLKRNVSQEFICSATSDECELWFIRIIDSIEKNYNTHTHIQHNNVAKYRDSYIGGSSSSNNIVAINGSRIVSSCI